MLRRGHVTGPPPKQGGRVSGSVSQRGRVSDGDALTDEGIQAALEIGRGLGGGYDLLVSSGARRATQTLACFACALREPVPGGTIVEAGLPSRVEERWRAAYERAGSGELAALREADPELVQQDSAVLSRALTRVFDRLPERGRALAVGHSPTNEAAVLGLTGSVMEPMREGAGCCSWLTTRKFVSKPSADQRGRLPRGSGG
jgi:broad specificity phosphatase PhoE